MYDFSPSPLPVAATALQMLIDGTNSTTNPFTIIFPPNITVSPTIHAFGQGRGNPSNCDMPTPATCPTNAPTPPPTTASTTCSTASINDLQNQLQLKDREVIGIAIGLLFGGILIGAILMLLIICICRCVCKGGRGSYRIGKNVQYQKHSDDVAFAT